MEHCLATGEPFPKILLLQIDGGSENTAKVFYALCQLLVKLDVFEEIEINRLPVGHTHDDIDALFGTLWTHMRNLPLMTPDQWKEECLKAFKSK